MFWCKPSYCHLEASAEGSLPPGDAVPNEVRRDAVPSEARDASLLSAGQSGGPFLNNPISD